MRGAAAALAVILLAGVVASAAVVAAREPSLDRRWDEDVRVLAGVEFLPDGTVRLKGIRDWRYTRDSVASKDYLDVRYDPRDITDLWLYEQELGLAGLIAHTFLVFEFDESYGAARWLGLSVETRREAGERYSIFRGMLRSFEVTHVWATEADLVTRRVVHLDYPLTRYRVEIAEPYYARTFRQFLRETAELASTPRWYNTITTNCTSSLIEYVNASEPGAIPAHYSSILTGRADAHMTRLGYLDAENVVRVTREFLDANALR